MMKMSSLIGLLWMVMLGVAFAADPIAKISGPPAPKVGDLLYLDSSESTPDTRRKWIVFPELEAADSSISEDVQQKIAELKAADPRVTVILPNETGPKLYEETDGGNRLFLAPRAGKYKIVLLVVASDGTFGVDKWEVKIPGNNPPTGPPDTPDIPDEPIPPPPPRVENRYNLEPESRQWLVQIPNETQVEKPAMALIWRTIGQGGVDGKYSSIKEISSALGATLNDANAQKHITKAAWKSWGESANTALVALVASGKIANAKDYGQAMLEIAEGISHP